MNYTRRSSSIHLFASLLERLAKYNAICSINGKLMTIVSLSNIGKAVRNSSRTTLKDLKLHQGWLTAEIGIVPEYCILHFIL